MTVLPLENNNILQIFMNFIICMYCLHIYVQIGNNISIYPIWGVNP